MFTLDMYEMSPGLSNSFRRWHVIHVKRALYMDQPEREASMTSKVTCHTCKTCTLHGPTWNGRVKRTLYIDHSEREASMTGQMTCHTCEACALHGPTWKRNEYDKQRDKSFCYTCQPNRIFLASSLVCPLHMSFMVFVYLVFCPAASRASHVLRVLLSVSHVHFPG